MCVRGTYNNIYLRRIRYVCVLYKYAMIPTETNSPMAFLAHYIYTCILYIVLVVYTIQHIIRTIEKETQTHNGVLENHVWHP